MTCPNCAELARKLQEAEAANADLLDLLSLCEFTDNSGGEYTPSCPVCGYGTPYHNAACRLHAAIYGNAPAPASAAIAKARQE